MLVLQFSENPGYIWRASQASNYLSAGNHVLSVRTKFQVCLFGLPIVKKKKMDFVMSSGVKVPNAVIVSGLLGTPEDEDVLDFLKKYGPITLVPVTAVNSEFHKDLIVKYRGGAAIEALAHLLPYTNKLRSNPDAKYCPNSGKCV